MKDKFIKIKIDLPNLLKVKAQTLEIADLELWSDEDYNKEFPPKQERTWEEDREDYLNELSKSGGCVETTPEERNKMFIKTAFIKKLTAERDRYKAGRDWYRETRDSYKDRLVETAEELEKVIRQLYGTHDELGIVKIQRDIAKADLEYTRETLGAAKERAEKDLKEAKRDIEHLQQTLFYTQRAFEDLVLQELCPDCCLLQMIAAFEGEGK